MTKKSSRRARRGSPRPPQQKPTAAPQTAVPQSPSAESASSSRQTSTRHISSELETEYRYVASDLKRIAVLTALIFAIMAALAIFLN